MDLNEAFVTYARKYYEGYDYKNTAKTSKGGKFKYGFSDLDTLHQEFKHKEAPDESKKHEDSESKDFEAKEGDAE